MCFAHTATDNPSVGVFHRNTGDVYENANTPVACIMDATKWTHTQLSSLSSNATNVGASEHESYSSFLSVNLYLHIYIHTSRLSCVYIIHICMYMNVYTGNIVVPVACEK